MRCWTVLALVALVFSGGPAGADGPSDVSDLLAKQGFTAVQLIRGANGTFQAIIQVDRYDNVKVLLDTGCTRTIVDSSWLSKRNYRTQEVKDPMQTLGGPHGTKTAIVDNIAIGKVNTGPMIVLCSSLEYANKYEKEKGGVGVIDGIIGMDLLTAHSAIIDVKKSTLYLRME